MPNNKLHRKLWKMTFGTCGYPAVEVDKQMDGYCQKLPGIKHRLKDDDPLRTGDYEDPNTELDKWRIVYRVYHMSVDCWWSKLSNEVQESWKEIINRGYYPSQIDKYFWEIIEQIVKNPLSVYEILPWECDPLPSEWIEYIKSRQTNASKINYIKFKQTEIGRIPKEWVKDLRFDDVRLGGLRLKDLQSW